MGKIFIFCRIQLKFCSWLYNKRWHTSWKFQLEQVIKKLSPKSLWQTYMKWTVSTDILWIRLILHGTSVPPECCDTSHPTSKCQTVNLLMKLFFYWDLVKTSSIPHTYCTVCASFDTYCYQEGDIVSALKLGRNYSKTSTTQTPKHCLV